jgi:hypothetical protein
LVHLDTGALRGPVGPLGRRKAKDGPEHAERYWRRNECGLHPLDGFIDEIAGVALQGLVTRLEGLVVLKAFTPGQNVNGRHDVTFISHLFKLGPHRTEDVLRVQPDPWFNKGGRVEAPLHVMTSTRERLPDTWQVTKMNNRHGTVKTDGSEGE